MDSLNVVSIKDKIPLNQKVFEELEPLTPEALAYLKKRFPEVERSRLDAFSLRYSKALHAIAIPSFTSNELLQGIKYRFIAPLGNQRYSAEAGSLFGGYWIEGRKDKLLIVEGEFDAISAKLLGFEGTILALQTNKLSSDSEGKIKSFQNIFLCLDSDEAGSNGKQEITSLIFNKSVKEVSLPSETKDLNELLQNRGLNEGHSYLQENTKTNIERDTVSLGDSLKDMVSYLSDSRNTRGDPTGFKKLDEVLGGGLRPCEMTVINAFAKTGKSSFVNNLIHNLALIGKKVAIASFEMDPARTLFPSLLSIAGQVNVREIRPEFLVESIEVIKEACPYLNNIVTFRRFGFTPWSEVEEWAALMKERHNIDYLVLDHAGFMVEKMTDAEENQVLAKNIKKLTNTLQVHIPVVVQAPKTKDGMSIQTSYGGLAWGMNSDNYIILERDKDDENLLKVKLEAARYPGANPSNTAVHLYYDRETCGLNE